MLRRSFLQGLAAIAALGPLARFPKVEEEEAPPIERVEGPSSALASFEDFVNSTGPTYFTSPDALINEAVKNQYAFARMLRGRR